VDETLAPSLDPTRNETSDLHCALAPQEQPGAPETAAEGPQRVEAYHGVFGVSDAILCPLRTGMYQPEVRLQ